MVYRTNIHVHLIGAGPGDPGLITVRGIECLKQADVVIYDRLVNPLLLQYAPKAEWIDAGKQPDHHPVPQSKINTLLVEKALMGLRVVRLKGGDPYVFGRGGEEAIALAEAGIPFEVVPGITSAIAAPAYAGIPVTHRGISQSVSFITGHSAKEDDLPEEWSCLAESDGTLVFLMGVHNLPVIVQRLLEGGRRPSVPVALIEQGTCARQRTITGVLSDIVEKSASVQSPAIIIVGEVVRLRNQLNWFEKSETRPLMGVQVGVIQPMHPQFKATTIQQALDDFCYYLSLLGATPVFLPSLKIERPANSKQLQETLLDLSNSPYQEPPEFWILFPDPTAIDFVCNQIIEAGLDLRIFAKLRIATLGSATSKHLNEYFLSPDLAIDQIDDSNHAEIHLALTGRQIIVPVSEPLPSELENILTQIQAGFTNIPIGSSQPDPVSDETIESLKTGVIDIITFFSPASVTGFLKNLEETLSREEIHKICSHSAIACIDEITARTAQHYGLSVNIISKEANMLAMISAMIDWKEISNKQ